MKRSPILGLAVVAIISSLSVRLHAFGFWLESPSRSNPNDPKGMNYHPAVSAFNTPGPAATSTPTASFTASPTAAGTFTQTPTMTSTPTTTPAPPTWYNGESAPYRLADLSPAIDTDITPGKGQMGISEATAGGGANGSATYVKVTFSAGSGTWYGRAVLGGPTLDASSSNTLSLWIRVPSNGCTTGFHPSIQLRTTGAWPNDRSAALTATAYLKNTTSLGYDTWVQVQIPLSAFIGPNPDGGTFSSPGLAAITAVVICAWDGMFSSNGAAPSSEIHVDDIRFLTLGTPPPASGRGVMFDDFENAGSTLWMHQAWGFSADGLPCTPTTSVSFPPAATAPVDLGGNSLSACHAGHMAGFQNPASPCVWSPAPLDPWPLVRMMVDLWSSPLNLSNNNIVGGLPATGAKGMIIRMKKGVTSPGQLYTIQLLRTATFGDWDNYHFRVADADLTSSWKEFRVAFPPDGQPAGTQTHTANATELYWAQEGWGAPAAWQRTDFLKMIIRAKNGGNFDLWVDDIEFY